MANDRDKGVIDFGSQDAEYAEKIAAVKRRAVTPPLPPIPRLDQSPGNQKAMQASVAAAKKILTPEQQEQLKAEGKFVSGIGSAYQVNQPGLEDTSPEQSGFVNPPRPPGTGLRPETVQQLQQVAAANVPTATEAEVQKDVDEVDEIDEQYETDEFGRKVRNPLANKARREAIEKRCEPMLIEDLISLGEVRQRVPIIPDKLTPVFRSLRGDEELFIKRLMSKERGSDQYITDRYSLMNLTAGLYSLNGKVLATHLDKEDKPDATLFEAKLESTSRHAFAILADLSMNYVWFVRRVQKLLVVDNIKGF